MNYRLFDAGNSSFASHQLWHHKEAKIKGFSEEGIKPGGVTAGELLEELEVVLNAFGKPTFKLAH